MTQAATMTCVDSLDERQRLVGWIVRDGILSSGMTYSKAALRWPMALATLNRLMRTGDVGLRFYRIAEMNLGLPRGLFELIIDGQADKIREMPIDEPLKTLILTELGAPPPENRRRRSGDA